MKYSLFLLIIHLIFCIKKNKIRYYSGLFIFLLSLKLFSSKIFFLNISSLSLFKYILFTLFYIFFSFLIFFKINLFGKFKNPLKILTIIDILQILYEEVVFRVFIFGIISYFYKNIYFAIFTSSLFFTLVHKFNSFLQLTEFLIFSIYISYVFWDTESFFLVVMIHLVRNYTILCILNEVDDEENK